MYHRPIFLASAKRSHSAHPLKPPCSEGLRMMYCGQIISSSASFSFIRFTPINSSSKAIGIGDFSHKSLIASHCPARIGCSILWIPKGASRCKRSSAWAGGNAPFASNRSSTCAGVYRSRRLRISESSRSKSIAPIFNFTQPNPARSFSSIRFSISSAVPIHTNPLIRIPSSLAKNEAFHSA